MEKKTPTTCKFKILGYSMKDFKHGSSNTLYNIEIKESSDNNPWTIKHTYDEFKQFHKDLKDVLKARNITLELPKLPKKSIMPLTKTKSLDKRQEELNTYINELSDAKYSQVFSCLKYIEFFDFQGQSKETICNKIHLVSYMRFDGFSIGNFNVERHSQAGNWM